MNPAALSAALNGDLSNALIASAPGGIERQEAQGQRDFVASTTLPKEISGATREQLEAIGFVFGADADDLFVNVTLPTGWSKKATDHSMHSDLLDEKGRKRAGIFYKAAFYDRNADMSMNRRFFVSTWADGAPDSAMPVRVMDGDAVAFEAGTYDRKAPKYFEAQDALRKLATGWLEANRPDYLNPLAYWD